MASHPASSRAESPPRGKEGEDSLMSRAHGGKVTQSLHLPLLNPAGQSRPHVVPAAREPGGVWRGCHRLDVSSELKCQCRCQDVSIFCHRGQQFLLEASSAILVRC